MQDRVEPGGLVKLLLGNLAAVLRLDQGAGLHLLAVGGLIERHGAALEHGGEGMGEGFHLGGKPGALKGADQGLEGFAHGAALQLVVVRNGEVVAAVFGEAKQFDFVIGGQHRGRSCLRAGHFRHWRGAPFASPASFLSN